MIKIVYNSNPNMSKDCNHRVGLGISSFSEQDYKEFETIDEAVYFWLECCYPITPLSDLPIKQMCNIKDKFNIEEIEAILKESSEADMQEEYLTNQKQSYSLVDNQLIEEL